MSTIWRLELCVSNQNKLVNLRDIDPLDQGDTNLFVGESLNNNNNKNWRRNRSCCWLILLD